MRLALPVILARCLAVTAGSGSTRGATVHASGFLSVLIDPILVSLRAVSDAMTDERLVAHLGAHKGRRYGGVLASATKKGHARAAVQAWAGELREHLEVVHTRESARGKNR